MPPKKELQTQAEVVEKAAKSLESWEKQQNGKSLLNQLDNSDEFPPESNDHIDERDRVAARKVFKFFEQYGELFRSLLVKFGHPDPILHQSLSELFNVTVAYADTEDFWRHGKHNLHPILFEWAKKLRDEAKTFKTTAPPFERKVGLDAERLQVLVGNKWHKVTNGQAKMLSILFRANGGFVSGKTIGGRPDKLRKAMPKPVAKIIETHRTDGYRIYPAMLK